MSAIKSKNTGIELILRKELFRRGYRYRIHYSGVPGKPDIAFPRAKVAIFCDSEFWHGHHWKEKKHEIRSNREYWIPKIERNIQRDKQVTSSLKKEGWTVLRFWAKQISSNPSSCVTKIEAALLRRSQW